MRTQHGLLRVVGPWDLVGQGINLVLASSVFVLPGITLAALGGWAPLGVALAALGALFVLLTFGDAAGRYRDPGGPYRYAGDAFGEYVGTQIGLVYWVVRATASAAVANVFVLYAGELWPAAAHPVGRAALVSAIVLGAGWLNYRGTRQTASVLNVITAAKILPLLVLCVVGLAHLSPEHFTGTPVPPPTAWARSTLLWVFAFGGFEATVIPASEARNPIRDIPRGLLWALAIVAIFYIAVQITVVGVLPSGPASTRPVGDVARILFGAPGALLIAVAAIIATYGHIPGSILAASRITYAIAERGSLPAVLARVHPRYRTPYISIILFTLLVWLLAMSGSYIWNASISAVGRLLVYVATAAGVLKLRRRSASAFPVPLWVHAVTIAFCVWLLCYQTLSEAAVLGTVLVGASAVWLAYRFWRRGSVGTGPYGAGAPGGVESESSA